MRLVDYDALQYLLMFCCWLQICEQGASLEMTEDAVLPGSSWFVRKE